LGFETNLSVAEDRSGMLVVGPEQGLALMPLDFACSRALRNASRTGRSLHLKGLLAKRSLGPYKPQDIAA